MYLINTALVCSALNFHFSILNFIVLKEKNAFYFASPVSALDDL